MKYKIIAQAIGNRVSPKGLAITGRIRLVADNGYRFVEVEEFCEMGRSGTVWSGVYPKQAAEISLAHGWRRADQPVGNDSRWRDADVPAPQGWSHVEA